MKIAFVRGPLLNPWELQSYQKLSPGCQIIPIGADWGFYQKAFIQMPPHARYPKGWGSAWTALSIPAAARYNRLKSWLTGASYGIHDLDQATQDADILHAAELHNTFSYQCLQIKRKTNQPLVLTVWENLPGAGEKHPRRRQRKQEVIRELDACIAVTETSRRLLIQEGVSPEKIDVIPMGIDLSRYAMEHKDPDLMNRLGIRSSSPVVLFIGRLVPEKGVLILLEAMRSVFKTHPDTHLVFLGEGPLAGSIQTFRIERPNQVHHVSSARYDDIPRWHSIADIFALPSQKTSNWEEQFGYVLVESMAAGKAIVTTRSGSIPDVVGDHALLSLPMDTESLAANIRVLLTDTQRRLQMGRNARARARQEFEITHVAARLEMLYEKTLRRSRGIHH